MKTPGWLVAIVQLLLTVSVPIILIVSPLYLFFTPAMVRHEYSREDFSAAVRFDQQERLRLSDDIMGYLRGKGSVDSLRSMHTDEGERALRESEVQHLVDVKGVLGGLYLAHSIAVIVGLAAGIALFWLTDRAHVVKGLQTGAWITVGCMAFVLVSSFVDFGVFFTRFHQVFFEPDTWVFYSEDTLIQLYPLAFWIDVVWKLGLFILVEAGILYILLFLAGRVVREGR
ncbi:MAG: TIGR01906 family membrane protein [Anaerolineales bacterium]